MSEKLWWVPDEKEVWTLAKQAGDPLPNGCMKFNLLGNGKQVMMSRELCLETLLNPQDASAAPNDLISLPEVNQASILSCARVRFLDRKIYTSVGTVLMSVNPFERFPNLYGNKMIKKYVNPFAENGSLAPHIYLVASRAFADMCRVGRDQSILISGESGAGKTEATKGCLDFLTEVAESNNQLKASGGGIKVDIAGRIIAASPILEAFGNAQTIKNPNSSRFGKWMELNFNSQNALTGSTIVSYLLEKSRVTRRDIEERNYHIFYQVLRGMGVDQLQVWNLSRDTSLYRYTERPGREEAKDLQDAKGLLEAQEAFVHMGFTADEVTGLFRIIAAVLHLGNVDFIDMEHGEASAVNTSSSASAHVAQLLKVDLNLLNSSLCHRTMKSGTMRGSVIRISLSPSLAADTRDSLARALYDRAFKDIIDKINYKARLDLGGQVSGARKIGLLDIFGFEIFPLNSLEQLCINYCNEMLQNHFNFVIFTAEKALYAAEGIHCDTIEFKDNLPIIQDIEKLFKSLDEEAKIPKGSSKTWYDKMRKAGSSNKASMVTYPPRKDIFIVKHYAGNVDYLPLGFMEKNNETLNNELIVSMISSEDELVKRLFDPSNDDTEEEKSSSGSGRGGGAGAGGQKKAQKSISWKFQSQLTSLMTMLRQTESHFIRCIKSNDGCQPMIFDAQLVHRQLLYSGVFEVVKIQQSGLPCRSQHREFIERFKCLCPSSIRWSMRSPSDLVNSLKSKLYEYDLPNIQVGSSLVFFKGMEQRLLESKRDNLLFSSAVFIQKIYRRVVRHRPFIKLIRFLRLMKEQCELLQTSKAEETLGNISQICQYFSYISSGWDIFLHVVQSKSELVELVRKREQLVIRAQGLVDQKSESALIFMQEIVVEASVLGILEHRTIATCNELVTNYEIALKFIAETQSEDTLSNLSLDEISKGILTLQSFDGIIGAAADAIQRATKWKEDVIHEIEITFKTLMTTFESSVVRYDEPSGRLVFIDAEAPSRLRRFMNSLNQIMFKCKDTKELFIDCEQYLTLVEDIIPTGDGKRTIDVCSSCSSNTSPMKRNLDSIRQWASIQLAVEQLRLELTKGLVPGSACGNENPVDTEGIRRPLELLKALNTPSREVESIVKVSAWIVKLRELFIQQHWNELEEFTFFLESESEKGEFEFFQASQRELENCIWLSSYQNALADVHFIIKESVFNDLPTDSVEWNSLIRNNVQGSLALQSAAAFSHPNTSPALEDLIPLARSLLELRQLMFDMDIEKSKFLVEKILLTGISTAARHNLSSVLNNEMTACKKLIHIVDCEEALHACLLKDQVKLYVSVINDGTGISPPSAAAETAGSFLELRSAIEKVEGLATQCKLPASLQNILYSAKKILSGRESLSKAEEALSSVEWDAVAEGMFQTTDGIFVLEDYQKEFDHIVRECARRSMWTGLKAILATKCVEGSRCIDLCVNKDSLQVCQDKYEAIAARIEDELGIDPPGNLLHLSSFTRSILAVRSSLLKKNWPEVYTSLANLQPLLNDDGLSVHGIVDEIELIRSEYIAQQEIAEMKEAVTDVLPFIGDNFSQEDKRIRMERLNDAIFLMKRLPGPEPARLVEVATHVRMILNKIMEGKINFLPEEKVKDAIGMFEERNFDTSNLQAILQFVRLRQILRTICDAMANNPTSESISEKLDTVRGALTMPRELLPWLHAAEAFSQLLQAVECRDWLLIVNRARYLEEVSDPLQTLERNDIVNENLLMDMIRNKYREGYKLALEIKAEEAQLQISAATEDVSVSEIRKRKLKEEDEKNPYGISNLRKAGYTEEKILEANFPLHQLWAAGFDASMLRSKGFSVLKLKAAGYLCSELLSAGYSVEQLSLAGYESVQLRLAGVTIAQLRDAGMNDAKILVAGYSLQALKSAGFDAGRLAKGGMGVRELVMAGFTGNELRIAGFDALQLRKAGLDNASYLRSAGYDLSRLKCAGFEPSELRQAGFDYDSLREEGFSDHSLLAAGFTEEMARETLVELFEKTQGRQWRIRLNWCTHLPLRQWYGIHTELAINQFGHSVEHVVCIDLHDNNLCGELPDRMWVFIHLKILSLSMNNLYGCVPQCLPQMTSLQRVDLSHNPLLKMELSSSSKIGAGAGMSRIKDSTSTTRTVREKGSVSSSGFTTSDVQVLDEVDSSTQEYCLEDFHGNTLGHKWKLRRNWLSSSPLKEWYGLTCNRLNLVVKLNLAMNNLQGLIPESIGSLVGLRELDLRYNQLSGEIPSTIGNLQNLTHLHLHCNRLSGEIPESIGQLSKLAVLDLRSNQLTGFLPSSLSNLSALTYFAVTSNLIKVPAKQAVRNKIPWCRAVVV